MKIWRASLTLRPNCESEFGEYETKFCFNYMGDKWEKRKTMRSYEYRPTDGLTSSLDILHNENSINKIGDHYIVTQAFEYELSEHEVTQVKYNMIEELVSYTKEEYEDVVPDFDNKRLALFEKLILDAYVMAVWGTSDSCNIWDSLPDVIGGE